MCHVSPLTHYDTVPNIDMPCDNKNMSCNITHLPQFEKISPQKSFDHKLEAEYALCPYLSDIDITIYVCTCIRTERVLAYSDKIRQMYIYFITLESFIK